MESIGDKIKQFGATRQHEIGLGLGIFLISLISFAAGYLYASQTLKESIEFEGFSGSRQNIEQTK